ncbi:MAG: prephenate dehydrogenase [Bacilli bacterium]|nr:prephenate dehydrogenase [Bacilli bacterium]
MSKFSLINKDYNILIVGLGLLGGSYAQGLSDVGFNVGAIDINQESIDYAINAGYIKSGQVDVTKEYVSQFDLIIFALYPKVFVKWLKDYQSFFKPGTIITDVTGIKTWLDSEIKEFIRDDIEYVLAHPMAGREVYGVKNADKGIFKGANYIVIPNEFASEDAIALVEDLGRILGFKNVVRLSNKEHDEMIGFLSQLTHCIAVSLMTWKEIKHLVEYTGDSFIDLKRIARINENMWSELFLLNKKELLSQMDLFLKQFTKLKETIENDDVEAMKNIMRVSTRNRSYFDK